MATHGKPSEVGALAPYYSKPGPRAGWTCDIVITSSLLPTDLLSQSLHVNKISR